MINIDMYHYNVLFLLIITISGNFLTELFGCSTRRILENNFYAKYVLLFFLIYFASNLNNVEMNPYKRLYESLRIWLFFLLFTKMNIYFTTLSFTLLTIIYILNDFQTLYQDVNIERYKFLQQISVILKFLLIFSIIYGVLYYFKSQYVKYDRNFKLEKFILGNVRCKNN